MLSQLTGPLPKAADRIQRLNRFDAVLIFPSEVLP